MESTRRKRGQGFAPNHKAAKQGGAIAGDARKALEAKSGKSVVSKENYLPLMVEPAAKAIQNNARTALKLKKTGKRKK